MDYSITTVKVKPYSRVFTPCRFQTWKPKSFKSSLINSKPYKNNLHHHLPSTSFTRRLRDFPPSSSAFERCEFSPRPNHWLKRFDGPIRLPEREENGAHYYQSVDIGMVLLGAQLAVQQGKVGECIIRPFLAKLAPHSALVALTLALVIPMLLSLLVERKRKRKWSAAFWMIFNSQGNMCSFWAAHFALTTWVAIHKGLSSAHFAFGCWYAFSALLNDEFGVEWHRGFHAEILNKIVEDFFQGRPFSHRKLKVLLGDPWLQIIAGALLGISVTFICHQGFMGAA